MSLKYEPGVAERADGRDAQRGRQGEAPDPLRGDRQRPRHQHLHRRRRQEPGRVPAGAALRGAGREDRRPGPRRHPPGASFTFHPVTLSACQHVSMSTC